MSEIRAPEGQAEVIETDFEIGQHNIEGRIGPFGFDIHNPVFMISGIAIVAFTFYALALPEQAAKTFMGLAVELLVAEYQHGMGMKGIADIGGLLIAQFTR